MKNNIELHAMNAYKKFEIEYIKIPETWKPNNYSYEETKELPKRLISSLEEMLDINNISYIDYVRGELNCMCDDKCNGNPFNFQFSEEFANVYARFDEKVYFFHTLLYHKAPIEDYGDCLLKLGYKLLKQEPPEGTHYFFMAYNILEFIAPFMTKYSDEILDYIDAVFTQVTENTMSSELGYQAQVTLEIIGTAKAKRLVEKFLHHPIRWWADLMDESNTRINDIDPLATGV